MSVHQIRVEGTTTCRTAHQVEEQTFTFDSSHTVPSSSSASSPSFSSLSPHPVPPSVAEETAALHSLVSLLTLARDDSNRFLTSLMAKYPKRQPHRDSIDSRQPTLHPLPRLPLILTLFPFDLRISAAKGQGGKKKTADDDDENDEADGDATVADAHSAPHPQPDLSLPDPKKAKLDTPPP